MNAPEFLTLRQACGLGQREAALFLCSTVRDVQRWETGDRGVPAAKGEALRELDARIRAAVSSTLAPFLRTRPSTPVPLHRYRTSESNEPDGWPFGAHVAVLCRIIDGLNRLGVPYTVAWADQGESNPKRVTSTDAGRPCEKMNIPL